MNKQQFMSECLLVNKSLGFRFSDAFTTPVFAPSSRVKGIQHFIIKGGKARQFSHHGF